MDAMIELAYSTLRCTLATSKGKTLLHILAQNGLAIICQTLLADPLFRKSDVHPGSRTISSLSSTKERVASGSLEGRNMVFNIDTGDDNGRTALHEAAHWGHNEVVIILMEFGADLSAQDRYGRTPMHYAAQPGHDEVIKTLHGCGADYDVRDKHGLAPLNLAVRCIRTSTVQTLLGLKGIQLKEPTALSKCSLGHIVPEDDIDETMLRHLFICRQLIDIYPNDYTILHSLGNCYMAAGIYSEASRLYDLVLTRSPFNEGVTEPSAVFQQNFCDTCRSAIRGYRYQCKVCRDFDMCNECYSLVPRSHLPHDFLRIPSLNWKIKA